MRISRLGTPSSIAFRWVILISVGLGLTLQCGCRHFRRTEAPLNFLVSFPESVREEALTARVLVFLSQSKNPEPRHAVSIFNLQPVFARDVEDLSPGEEVVFEPSDFQDPDALAFPKAMDRLTSGVYYAQALFDMDQTIGSYSDGPGNLITPVKKVRIHRSGGGTIKLIADRLVESDEPEDTEWVKLVETRSERLSQFHGRDMTLRAGVILPVGYTDNEERYPVVYEIPGFGGRHHEAWTKMDDEFGEQWKGDDFPLKAVWVVLDPELATGHCLFADSANNGPVGAALTQELMPEIERRFRIIRRPEARLLRGHSSGGWSALWLQINYPDLFGGCWSLAPDPVDFRAFQLINIYEDESAYWDGNGFPRPSMRIQGEIRVTIRDENRLEYVTGPGGQWQSWFAVFGPKAPDGLPIPLWDPLAGEIDPQIAESWKAYDIRMKLEENWNHLGHRLKGKLHILCGYEDSFYLNRAVKHLSKFLDQAGHDSVEFLPGGHGSFLTKRIRLRILEEMAKHFECMQPSPSKSFKFQTFPYSLNARMPSISD